MKITIILILFFLFLPSCKDDAIPPKPDAVLTLTLEDVSCTEAWVKLTTSNLQLPTSLDLLKDDSIIKTIKLQTSDTLLYIDSLLPNQTYNFTIDHSGLSGIHSNELSVTTLDTTSHNFTWQMFEFGIIANQSHLFDVAIINENDIWAVGAIYLNDSLGNSDPQPYSVLKWNGTTWQKTKLKYFPPGSIGDSITATGYSIFAFNENDVWISGGAVFHWNGFIWKTFYNTGAEAANKIWGSSSNDVYFVGRSGSIIHYNGSQWRKIESGTNLSLIDIAVNSSNEIFICGGNSSLGQGIILKSSDGNNFSVFAEGANILESQLFNPKLYGSFSSIWFDQNNTLYSGGNILFQNKFKSWSYVKSLPENFIGGNPGVYFRGYITKVRGNASNDMWIVGDRNTLRHFNGFSWEQIGMPYDPNIDIVWRGMACKDNNTIIVGTHNRNATIMMIKK